MAAAPDRRSHRRTRTSSITKCRPDFFGLVLGPHRKYSCCYYDEPVRFARPRPRSVRLRLTVEHARLAGRAGHSGTRLRLGLAVAVHGADLSDMRASPRYRIRIRSANSSRTKRSLRQIRNLKVVTCDMNDFATDGTFRPRGVGRDVRAHVELARAVRARALLDEAGRALLHACVQPSPRPLSLRDHRQGRLDRAVFLHRRHHAEPQSAAAILRSVRGRTGLAMGRHALRAHGARLACEFRRAARRDHAGAARGLWRRMPRSGRSAGASSSSRPRACSAMRAARNGASAITG